MYVHTLCTVYKSITIHNIFERSRSEVENGKTVSRPAGFDNVEKII